LNRTFEKQQWKQLSSTLTTWKANLVQVRQAIQDSREKELKQTPSTTNSHQSTPQQHQHQQQQQQQQQQQHSQRQKT
jgi:hypothetical protein